MKTVLRFVYCVAKIIYGCQHANHQGQKLLVLTGSCTANWASGYFGDMLPHIRVEYEFNTRSILIYCTINVEKKNLLLKQKLKESWVADVEKRNIYWGRKTFMLKAWNIFFSCVKTFVLCNIQLKMCYYCIDSTVHTDLRLLLNNVGFLR